MAPPASIVIPTRARLPYLEVALASIAQQAAQAAAEVLVIDDAGASAETRELAVRFGARYVPHPRPLGLNVARNTGVARSTGALVTFVDDDVEVSAGWLGALLRAAEEHTDVDVFTGPIRVRLEGRGGWGSHSCGREGPPITSLELGPQDTDARYAWGANMAIRRSALERVGPFDVSLEHGGDEQEWQERMRAETPGARVLYVAAAAVEHRRVGADASLRSLSRGAYTRGLAARRFDSRRGQEPSLLAELATLGGCAGHVVRYRCPAGLTMLAHSAGRVRSALHERRQGAEKRDAGDPAVTASAASEAHANGQATPIDDFLSGTSGTVGGLDGVRREAMDAAVDTLGAAEHAAPASRARRTPRAAAAPRARPLH